MKLYTVPLAIVAVVAAAGLFAYQSRAGKPAEVPPLHLYQSSYAPSGNPTAPDWCLNEDDFDWRKYYGFLTIGSYSTTFRLCDDSVDYSESGGQWWGAGSEGVFLDLEATGTLTDMTITSPSGVVTHALVVGSSTTGHGANQITTYHWQTCVVPHFFISSDTSDETLEGGTYTAILYGNFPEATWTTWVGMATVDRQRASCPEPQRNLTL